MLRCGWLVVLVLTMADGSMASANPSDDAASRFRRGLTLFHARQYTAAREAFEEAYRISPNVRVLANVAACFAQEDRPVEAVRTYRRFVYEASTDVQASALEAARLEIERLRRNVGDIALAVEPDGAEVRIDGESAGLTPLSAPIAVAPGQRLLEVRKTGYLPISRSVDVGANREVGLSIALQRLPEGAGDDQVDLADASPQSSSRASARRAVIWSGVGLSAALGIAAAVTGTFALEQLDEYDDTDTSRSRRRDLYDSMRTLATITDVLIDGAVVIGAATVLLALWPAMARPAEHMSVFTTSCRVEGRCELAFAF